MQARRDFSFLAMKKHPVLEEEGQMIQQPKQSRYTPASPVFLKWRGSRALPRGSQQVDSAAIWPMRRQRGYFGLVENLFQIQITGRNLREILIISLCGPGWCINRDCIRSRAGAGGTKAKTVLLTTWQHCCYGA